MADLPIKGQETTWTIVSPTRGLVAELDKIKEANFTFLLDIITEQYLGQTADEFDNIFRGVSLDLTVNLRDPKAFKFCEEVINVATRRASAAINFQVCTTLRFPNGQRSRVLFPRVLFGEVPNGFGKRDEYVEQKFTGKCSTFKRL